MKQLCFYTRVPGYGSMQERRVLVRGPGNSKREREIDRQIKWEPERETVSSQSCLREQIVPVRTYCRLLIGSFLIWEGWCQRTDGEQPGSQEPMRPLWHSIKAGMNATCRQSGTGWALLGTSVRIQAQHPGLSQEGVIATWAFLSAFQRQILNPHV